MFSHDQIFQVIYSSVVVFTAIWVKLFLPETKRVLTIPHWCAIIFVTLGLMVSALGSSAKQGNDSIYEFSEAKCNAPILAHYILLQRTRKLRPHPSLGATPTIGIVFSLAATLTFSFHYVLTEHVLTSTHIEGKRLQLMNGLYATALVTCYMVVFTLPNFDSLVTQRIQYFYVGS